MDASTEGLVDSTGGWWSSVDALQRDLWMHMNTPLSLDGYSTEGLVDAYDQPWDHHSEGYQGRETC